MDARTFLTEALVARAAFHGPSDIDSIEARGAGVLAVVAVDGQRFRVQVDPLARDGLRQRAARFGEPGALPPNEPEHDALDELQRRADEIARADATEDASLAERRLAALDRIDAACGYE